MTTRDIFRENLKFYRKKAGMTQEQLAEKINCSPKYISSIESKSKFPSPETIDLISDVLKVKPSLLLEDNGCPVNLISFDKEKFTEDILSDLHCLLKEDILDFLQKRFPN